MKILVSCKETIDPYVKVHLRQDKRDVELHNVKMAMNPFDEIALEQAIQCREAGVADEVIIISIGLESAQTILRKGLAMGADRAIFIPAPCMPQPLDTAKILKKIVDREQCQLVLMGKQSIDNDANETPQMLAAKLNWPQALFASHIDVSSDHATVTREIDGGSQTLQVKLPCVISADLRLNTPRFAKLPDIVKAKNKPLQTLSLEELAITLNPRLTVLQVASPPQRPAGKKVNFVEELVKILREQEKVIA
jgi:electron transfer flavoprotein beta subunit